MPSLLLLALNLVVPALVYIAIAIGNRQELSLESVMQLGVNYLLMAAPHIALAVAATPIATLRRSLLRNLVVLNVVLIAFAAWVWFKVPQRESGLAWVLYYPLACAALAAAWLVNWLRTFRQKPSR